MKKFQLDKQYTKYSIYVLLTAVLIVISYRIISNAELILREVGSQVSRFFDVIAPITLALILSYILNRPVKRLELFYERLLKNQKKVSTKDIRIFSIVTVYILIIFIFSLIANFIIPQLTGNLKELANNIPAYRKEIEKQITNLMILFERYNINIHSRPFQNWINSFDAYSRTFIEIAVANFKVFTLSVINLIIALIISFYFLKDKEKLLGYIEQLGIFFAEDQLKKIKGYLIDIDRVLGKFMIGVITDASIVGIVATILMTIIQHKFSFLVGIVVGVSNIVPYVGPLFGAVFGSTLGLMQGTGMAITTFVVILLLQQVDGNIMQPRIVGGKVGLEPVIVIMAVLIGGRYFGVLGMVLAVPTTAIIKLFLGRLVFEKKLEKGGKV